MSSGGCGNSAAFQWAPNGLRWARSDVLSLISGFGNAPSVPVRGLPAMGGSEAALFAGDCVNTSVPYLPAIPFAAPQQQSPVRPAPVVKAHPLAGRTRSGGMLRRLGDSLGPGF